MPTMQKAFVIQNLQKVGEVERADFIVGNVDAADTLNIVSMLRDGSAEQQLQQATQASHGELSRKNAELKEALANYVNNSEDLCARLDRANAKLAQMPRELNLLTMLSCERVEVDTAFERVIFVPRSIEMHNGVLTIFGTNDETKMIRRFTTDQIVRFCALPSDAPHDNMPSP